MAITEAALTVGHASVVASQATASISPTADRLVLVAVTSYRASTPNVPTITGAGMTWELVATVPWSATSEYRVSLFRGLSSSPGSGALTIDFAGQTQTRMIWSIAEFDGVHLGGTNGSAAVRQAVANNGSSTTPFALLLPQKAASGAYAAAANAAGNTTAPGASQTEIHDDTDGQVGLGTMWKATPVAFPFATITSSGWGCIGVELRDAADPNNDGVIPDLSSFSTNKQGNTNTDLTVTFASDGPATPNPSNAPSPGDLYIVSCEIANFTLGTNSSCATPSAFDVGPSSFSTSGSRHGMFTFLKVMDGTETSIVMNGSPAAGTNGMSVKVARIAAGTFDPNVITQATTAQNANNTSINLLGLTTTKDDAMVMYFFGCAAAAVRTVAPPVELAEQWDFGSDPGDAATHSMAAIIQGNAGATGTKTFTPSATSLNDGVCIAVQPLIRRPQTVVVNQAVARSTVS